MAKEDKAERSGKGEKPKDEKKKDAGKKPGKPRMRKQKDIGKDARYIVRIVNKDLDGTKPVRLALSDIKGIGLRAGLAIAKAFEKETGISPNEYLGKVPEEKDKIIEEIILNPLNHGIPSWMLNRRKDFDSGKNLHLVMSDLDITQRGDFQRMGEMKTYKGLRHQWGLTVRGQRTKSTHRGKGGVIGVLKKEAKEAAAAKGAKGE